MPPRRIRPYPAPGFGKQIKEARISKGWNQAQLAQAVGSPRGKGTVSLWETEKIFPDDHYLKAIGDVLGIEVPLPRRNKKGRKAQRIINCKQCGKEMGQYYGEQFCSRSCSSAYLSEHNVGEKAGGWKGGKGYVGVDGYVYIYSPSHPRKKHGGHVAEHRLVMEKAIGRYLEPHETVHHKNGDRHDNRIENLELWAGKHKSGVRLSDLLIDRVLSQPEIVALDELVRDAIKVSLKRVVDDLKQI